jgi:ABC-2 type transport system permease protein
VNIVTNTGTAFAREMMPTLRNPAGLLVMMAQPLIFLLLFGPLLPSTGDQSPWQWFVPGILVMMGLVGTSSAGYSLQVELSGGSLERMLVTPLNRAAMLVGRTLKEVVILLAQAVLIMVAAIPLGFRLHTVGALAGLAMIAVLGVGLGSLSFALAIATKRQQELFWGVQQVLLFPLLLLSGVLLPTDTAPGWLRALSQVNPVTYVVDAERALFAGSYAEASVRYGALAAVVIAALGLALGTRAMRRASL